jgi:HlyD family secretion protein
MRLPRPRYTILSLMLVVLVASLVLAIFVAYRERQRRRANQQITIASAQANYLNAQLTRQVAEIAVTEFTEGILKADLETVESEIVLAKTNLMRAEERLAAAERERKTGDASESSLAESEKEARRAKLRLQHAQERKSKLVTATKERILKELNDEVEAAKANELTKKAVYELEKAKLRMIGFF